MVNKRQEKKSNMYTYNSKVLQDLICYQNLHLYIKISTDLYVQLSNNHMFSKLKNPPMQTQKCTYANPPVN